MKKIVGIALVVVISLLGFVGCTTTNLETNQVCWSSYSDTVVKDYDAVKIIKVQSTETITYSPLHLKTFDWCFDIKKRAEFACLSE